MIRRAVLACLALVAMTAPAFAQDGAAPREAQLETIEQARIAGDYAQAREGLERLLAQSPDDADLLRRLASVSAAQGRLDEAQRQIDRASRIAPDDLDIQLARANILYWRGDFDGAERQAAAIASLEPGYPELDILRAKLDAERRRDAVRVTALAIGGGISEIQFDNRGDETWSSQTAALGLALSRDSGIGFAVEREERAVTDVRLSARADHRLGDNSIYVSGSVVPDPDFRESWGIGAGGEADIGKNARLLVDLRYADYRNREVFVAQPGLRVALGDAFSVTGRAINLFGGGEDYRIGGALQLDYRPEQRPGGFAVVSSYPDVEADGVRQLRSAALGIDLPLAERLTLTTVAAYEDRKNSYRRISGNMVLRIRFGSP